MSRRSVTFDSVSRFANFQIAYDPGKEITLGAAIVLLVGLTTSLAVRRRRLWLRVSPADGDGSQIEVAGYSLTRREPPPDEIDDLVAALHGPQDSATTKDAPA